jgi:hypothetical protein
MKQIKDYENYCVTEDGKVYSKIHNRFLKLTESHHNYLRVKIRNKNGYKIFSVHRLIAIVFLPNPENKPQVNHINGNKKDNRVINLEWATREENMQHAFKTGLMKNFYNSAHKIVLNIENGVFYESVIEASKSLNMNYSTLRSMLQGHRKNKTNLIYA